MPVLAAVALVGCATQSRPFSQPPIIDGNGHGPAAEDLSLEQMLEQDDFDLPRALLLFSKKYYPEFASAKHDLDVEATLRRFDTYLEGLTYSLRRERSPRRKLLLLIDFVHVKLGLRFDAGDKVGLNPENLFFDRVLNRRFGYCVTLSMAYLVFGQAAGLDVQGMRIPGHFVVRFRHGEGPHRYETIIETTDYGAQREETYYWQKHRFSIQSQQAGVYLSPINDREIFSTIYNNLAGLTHSRGNSELAVKRYTYALELAPNNAEALYNRAIVTRKLGRPQEALRDLNQALRLDPNFWLALLARSGLLWEAGEKEKADLDLTLAIRRWADKPAVHMLHGQFLMNEDRIKEARDAFLRALEVDETYLAAHEILAKVERSLGNESAARKHEEAAGAR